MEIRGPGVGESGNRKYLLLCIRVLYEQLFFFHYLRGMRE